MNRRDQSEPIPESSRASESISAAKIERSQAEALKRLEMVSDAVEKDFQTSQRVLSFPEYLKLFASHPARYGRSAAHYVHDMFLHYGTEEVTMPWGTMTRFRLFSAPWRDAEVNNREPHLIGHEALQRDLFGQLCNFVKEGRPNRLVLLHGPNGSAKTTAASCIMRALEKYSQTDEGALYRFHWIFPTRKTSRGAIGFGSGSSAKDLETYAYLEDDQIDARLLSDQRDHPLFLLPPEHRRALLHELYRELELPDKPPEWLCTSELCHKNKQIYEALLASYHGSIREVLKHVQIERYYISRRYRVGAITIGPEMSVDAGVRQLTADRSIAALPTSLQAVTLFETHGELIEADGGVLEFSDLLKRPLDAFRYLQLTLESGEVSLTQQTLFTNTVMIGSANDIHLAAFRKHPEYASFQARIELVKVPYLRSYLDEEQIYQTQIVPQLGCHVAPHAVRLAAEFAVLTRLRRPDPSNYREELAKIVKGLDVLEKLILYSEGEPPKRLSNDERKLLKANIDLLYSETEADADYEGATGASPRSMRTLLLDAAQNNEYHGLSPFAVLKALDQICKRTDFDWLEAKPLEGKYHDHTAFRAMIRTRLMDRIEADIRRASNLIDDSQYHDLFGRYISHVSAWVKSEKIRNHVTGKDEDPDTKLMSEVEGLLGITSEAEQQRHNIISQIAAWAIDHPGAKPVFQTDIFPGYVKQLQDAAFAKLRKRFSLLLRHTVTLLQDDGAILEKDQRQAAEELVGRLCELGYDEHSALDACSNLIRDRFSDIIS